MVYRLENGNECASLALREGGAVLFRSGSVTRGWIDTVPGVTYGAWGDGDSPVISGTDDVSSASDWEEVGDCVWECVKTIRADVGNLIFNGGDCSASLRWGRSDLCRDGDFFDESFGRGFGERGADSLYLFCDGNPAKKYSRIETVPFGHRKLAHVRDGATFEGLIFTSFFTASRASAGISRCANAVSKRSAETCGTLTVVSVSETESRSGIAGMT